MKIDSYRFGKMVVDGKLFDNDLIIRPGCIEDNWWRVDGHTLMVEDIRSVIEEDKPDVLVVGTGKYGILKVCPDTETFLKEKDVDLIAVKTDKAVAQFNRINSTKKVVGCFHLTC